MNDRSARGLGREARSFSLGAKLAGATIFVVLIAAGALFIALTRYERASLLAAKAKSALMLARLNSDSLSASVVFDDANGISEVIANLARNDEVIYAAVWSLADGAPAKLGPVKAELRRTPTNFARPAGPSRAERTELSHDWILIETPILDPSGKVVGMSQAAFSLAQENAAIRAISRRFLLLTLAVAFVLTSVLMLLARRIIVRPLARLVGAAESLEAGQRAVITMSANDEIGSLARALQSMSGAIANREQRLKQRNRDMSLVLENVEEGFLILNLHAKMGAERSSVLDTWFGEPPADFSFASYLRDIDAHLARCFDAAWQNVIEGVLPLEFTVFQLPSSFQYQGRSYVVRYRPILDEERLMSMLVVISDVSERVERERAELLQREMVAVFRQLVLNHSAFAQFYDEAESLMSSIESASTDDQVLVKRQLHTLKGNCAMFGIQSVTTACHEIETRMSETGGSISPAEKQRLRRLWSKVADYCEQLGERARAGRVELDAAEYANFVDALRVRLDHDALRKIVASWKFEAAAQRLYRLAEQIEQLAVRLDRAHVQVECAPTTIRLPPKKWNRFWSVFTHVLRNALDHGIESAEEREQLGKPPGGRIRLAIEVIDGEVVISIADDGRGVAWATLAERAKQHGLPATTEADLIEAMFTDGLSSREEVTETSGRGVGLGAVRAVVRELGGRVEVSTEAGKGSTFRFALPRSMLDENPEASGPSSAPPKRVVQAGLTP